MGLFNDIFGGKTKAQEQQIQDANVAAAAAAAAAAKAKAPIQADQTPDSEVEQIKRRMLDVFADPRRGRSQANLLGARPFDDTAYQRASLG